MRLAYGKGAGVIMHRKVRALFGTAVEELTWVGRNLGDIQDNSTTTRPILLYWTSCQSYFCKLAQEMRLA